MGEDILKVARVEGGPFLTNSYVVYSTETRDAVIIDPVEEDELIKKISGLNPRLIVNTHGHFDHILANDILGLPVAVHSLDDALLTDPAKNLSLQIGLAVKSPAPSILLNEGDVIEVGRHRLAVFHTPGHTEGSICLVGDGIIFSGDTLFEGSIGRTDLPGGDFGKLSRSLERLKGLAGDYIIYPGHGEPTTLVKEKRSNPYLCSTC